MMNIWNMKQKCAKMKTKYKLNSLFHRFISIFPIPKWIWKKNAKRGLLKVGSQFPGGPCYQFFHWVFRLARGRLGKMSLTSKPHVGSTAPNAHKGDVSPCPLTRYSANMVLPRNPNLEAQSTTQAPQLLLGGGIYPRGFHQSGLTLLGAWGNDITSTWTRKQGKMQSPAGNRTRATQPKRITKCTKAVTGNVS